MAKSFAEMTEVSHKQQGIIELIEDTLNIDFKGTTKMEATEFIKQHLPDLKDRTDSWSKFDGY